MNNKNCNMIKDLLPLYIEDMCSEESKNFVNEHLAGCKECRDELEKLNAGVSVAADKDISAIKSVKKKLRTGKIIIAAVVLVIGFCAGYFGFYIPMSICCTMDYEKYDLAENVWVEEDADGTVWLCKKDDAATADLMLTNLKDTDGNFIDIYSPNLHGPEKTNSGFKKDNADTMLITLQHRRFNELSFIKSIGNKTERTLILDTSSNQKIDHISYYDSNTGTEYTLWERK